jgi:hypothetical protein
MSPSARTARRPHVSKIIGSIVGSFFRHREFELPTRSTMIAHLACDHCCLPRSRLSKSILPLDARYGPLNVDQRACSDCTAYLGTRCCPIGSFERFFSFSHGLLRLCCFDLRTSTSVSVCDKNKYQWQAVQSRTKDPPQVVGADQKTRARYGSF